MQLQQWAASAALSLAVLAPNVSAQNFVATGDLAAATIVDLAVMNRGGTVSTSYGTPTSVGTILWDPSQPDSFIMGNTSGATRGGAVIRATFVAPGQVVSTSLSPSGVFNRPVQLSWDQSGNDVIAVSSSEVHRINASTGAVTPITIGGQGWGSTATSGMMDPLNGDIYVGTSGGAIWRLPSGAGTATQFASGLGSIRRILIDSTASPHFMFYVTDNSVGRFDLRAPAQPAQTLFGKLGQPALSSIVSAQFDERGDFVLCQSWDVYRLANPTTIPPGGIAPVFLASYALSSGAASCADIAVVGGTTRPFRLEVEAVPVLGASFSMENVPGPISIGWLFISMTTTLPVDTGPFFGLQPDLLTLIVLTQGPSPGGPFAFTGTAPAPFSFPILSMAPFAGQTWDFVAVSFGPSGALLGRSNVERVTWR